MQLEFYWDAGGDARARCKGTGSTLAGFLESDLQGSPSAAQEVLRAVDDVESGRVPSWERTGNSYTLTLSHQGASLRNEMDEDAKPHHLSLPAVRDAVADWLSFLEADRR
jgi:uncharacterized protein YacL (UPF0231 family)